MAEKSFVWAGITTGDADQAPYDSDEWTDIYNTLFIKDNTDQGYIEGYLNELAITNPAGSTIRVATGGALVDGNFYETDANVDNTIATPAVSTRIDRYVLRKSWAAQTVRVAIVAGVEGAGAPSLTQTDGVTWEIPLAQVSITTGAAITITDERVICRSPLGFDVEGSQVVIETKEGDGVTTVFDFQNIPQTYQHLLIIGTVRSDIASAQENLEMRFNADAGANYAWQQLEGDNATPAASTLTAQNELKVAEVIGDSSTAGYAGQFRILISNYKGAIFNKTFQSEWQMQVLAGLTIVGINGGAWADTSAISRIQLILAGANAYIAGTAVTLYGIKG